MPRALRNTLFLAVTIPLGLAARYGPLPWFFAKYLGSMLWAAALYWLIAIVLKPRAATITAAATAILVELSRLVPEPHIDAFRLTLAGRLLLGRYFSVWNIAAYLVAIALTYALDKE